MDRRTYNLAIVSFIGQSGSSLYWVRPLLLWNPGGKHAYIVILRCGIARYFIFHDALGSPSELHLYGMP